MTLYNMYTYISKIDQEKSSFSLYYRKSIFVNKMPHWNSKNPYSATLDCRVEVVYTDTRINISCYLKLV